MNKKIALMTLSLLIVGALYISFGKSVLAGCQCVQVPGTSGTGLEYDSTGVKIPSEAYGQWRDGGEEPRCPAYSPSASRPAAPDCYGLTTGNVMKGGVMYGCACNVYTQGFVKTWFRVPTLGDLIGNAVRLIFFISGLYALVLLLLGGFEWVSSGGEDKKLEGARNKIINAIIGLIVMVAVLTLVIVLEQVVFGGKVCLGISCPINMGDLRIIK